MSELSCTSFVGVVFSWVYTVREPLTGSQPERKETGLRFPSTCSGLVNLWKVIFAPFSNCATWYQQVSFYCWQPFCTPAEVRHPDWKGAPHSLLSRERTILYVGLDSLAPEPLDVNKYWWLMMSFFECFIDWIPHHHVILEPLKRR